MVAGVVQINFQVPAPGIQTTGPSLHAIRLWQILRHRRHLCDTIGLETHPVQPAYVIGIDLGTTNSALAYAEVHADADPFSPANVQLMDIPQW